MRFNVRSEFWEKIDNFFETMKEEAIDAEEKELLIMLDEMLLHSV